MTIRNSNKTGLKHNSPCEMKTFLKRHRKTLCERLCWTFHYGLKTTYILAKIKCS